MIRTWKRGSYPLANKERSGDPEIWVTYSFNGKRRRGKFIIDTGSTCNHLYYCRLDKLPITPVFKSEKEVYSMYSRYTPYETTMKFMIGEKSFDEPFSFGDEGVDEPVNDSHIIGILGCRFLFLNRLALDLDKGGLSINNTTDESRFARPDNVEYVFDLKDNLEYGCPHIRCYTNCKVISCLLDSGGCNVVHKNTLGRYGIKYADMNEKDKLQGSGYCVDAETYRLKLTLSSFIDEFHEFKTFDITDDFVVVNDTEKFEGNSECHIKFGNEFLWAQAWVIDLWSKMVYRRKNCIHQIPELTLEIQQQEQLPLNKG